MKTPENLVSSGDIYRLAENLPQDKKEKLLAYYDSESKRLGRISFAHLSVRANCHKLLDNDTDEVIWKQLEELTGIKI